MNPELKVTPERMLQLQASFKLFQKLQQALSQASPVKPSPSGGKK